MAAGAPVGAVVMHYHMVMSSMAEMGGGGGVGAVASGIVRY
jgi:hypothetical protein